MQDPNAPCPCGCGLPMWLVPLREFFDTEFDWDWKPENERKQEAKRA